MNNLKLLFLGMLLLSFCLKGQTPVADFSGIPSGVCLNQQIQLVNQSTNATANEWDFCETDLLQTPQFSSYGAVSSSTSLVDLRVLNDGGNWYGFVCDADGNKLTRLNFGTSLANTPTSGTIGSFATPTGLDIFKIDGIWYGLVATFNLPSRLYLLKFGSSLSFDPVVTPVSIPTNAIVSARSLKMVEQDGNFILFVANWSQSSVTRINFGSTLSGNVVSTDAISVPGSSNLIGLSVMETGISKYVFLSSYSTNQLFKLDFGNTWLSTTPAVGIINDGGVSISPTIVQAVYEGGNYYLVTANNGGNVIRMNFGSDLTTFTPSVNDLGTFGDMANIRGMNLVRNNHSFSAILSSVSTNKIYKLDFQNTSCAASVGFYDGTQPPWVSFSTTGSFPITLRVYNDELLSDKATQNVVTSALPSPDLTIVTNNKQCLGQPNGFSVTSSQVLTGFSWDFGEAGGTSSSSTPTYLFAAYGKHKVTVGVTSSNGCSNLGSDSIKVMSPPDFTMPSTSPICTNQLYNFKNATLFDVAQPTWQWNVNGTDVSTQQDLSYAITNTAAQTIKLTGTLDGCTNNVTKSITTVEAGPTVDFTVSGICEKNATKFTNLTVGSVSNYTWTFGDGNTSTATNPQELYTTAGVYAVSLAALTSTGCNNSLTKNIVIYSQPQTDFSIALPPFSCSGSLSQFNDLTPHPTDSNLASWQWDFADPSSGQNSSTQKNPLHTYASAGAYAVKLTVTTDVNCSTTVQKSISIAQTPIADFSNTPACLNQATTFTDATPNSKAWNWQIGSTFTTLENPVHVFASSGNYTVSLSVTGNNNCVSFISKIVSVPVSLSPDFSSQKNCTLQNTTFTDLTPASTDPVVKRDWDFAGMGSATGSPAVYSFEDTGNYGVKLKVTAQSGCTYTVAKNVNIIDSPVASFTPTPNAGVPPLLVHFNNTSSLATSYLWTFNDTKSSTSAETSPTYTFNDFGDYVVDLTAFNAQGCSSTSSKIISAILPSNDIAITILTTTTNTDGSLNAIATLQNNSNVAVSNISILMDLSGNATIRETINATIAPNQLYNHLFNYAITNVKQLQYICAEAQLENDIDPYNNRLCTSLGQELFIYDPYPNPARGELHVDFISNDEESISIRLVDTLGKQVFLTNFQVDPGLNQYLLPLDDLTTGIYVLTIQTSTMKKISQIAVYK